MISFENLETAESLQIIRDIAAEIWPQTFADILSPEQISYMMHMMYAPEVMEKELHSKYHFILVRADDAPAGYIVWSASNEKDTAKLHKLYLLKKYHGQKIGSAMLTHTAKAALSCGFTTLTLNVNKYNTRAINVYKRNGFIQTDAVKIDIGEGFFMDDFVMSKKLIAGEE